MKRILVIAVAVLVAAAIAVAGYTRASESLVRAPYSARSDEVRIGGTGYCAVVTLRAALQARTAPSGLLGWSQVRVVDPEIRATTSPCTSEAEGGISRIVVSQQWTPRSCRLQVVADSDFVTSDGTGDQTGDQDPTEDDLAPWRLQAGPCSDVPVATYGYDGSELSVTGQTGTLEFRGRSWGSTVCFTPTVDVRVRWTRDQAVDVVDVPISLPDACATR